VLRVQCHGGSDALGRVAGWHPDVDDRHVGLGPADGVQQRGDVADAVGNLHADRLEQESQPLAEDA